MSKIADRHIDRAKKLVRQKFPEMAGAEPSVHEKRSQSKRFGRGSPSSKSESPKHYVLTFENDVSLPGGRSLRRLVRVTMDESGQVVKLTSSK